MGRGTDQMAENGFSLGNTPAGPSFMELYEESLKSIQEGKVVKGQILQIDKEYVLVDIGYKSEGTVRIAEFMDSDGHVTAAVGDEIEVLLVRKEDEEGRVILSKEKAAKVKLWDDIENAYKTEGIVRGKIISKVKGGLVVDIGLRAFLPGSQADLPPVKNRDPLIGTEHDFRVIKYEKEQGNIVVSRRAVLEAERMALLEETLEGLEEGAAIPGTVTSITDYGLFIDLGGIDGLVHITNISWGKVGHPSEAYKIGDKVTVKILNIDRERKRVSLGIKQLTPGPWNMVQDKYPVGTRVTGRVASLKKYGAFLELEEGLAGLVHISEMSWTRKIRHPSEVLSTGNTVEAIVLDINVAKERISLSIRQLEPNPWDSIAENYPVGAVIEGKIKDITDFGIFIGIDEGIDGLVHTSNLSWTRQINHPSQLYKKGEKVQAIILNIDKENQHFSLGIKQLTPDPWNDAPEKYKPGTRVSGTVTNITEFGLFVELEEGIEGLIHVSQLPKRKDGNPMEGFQIRDEIEAEVVNVSQEDKRIELSTRRLEKTSKRGVHNSYLDNQEKATSNLGDLLREKMLNVS
jgi:small subunit ribosomal protein S1